MWPNPQETVDLVTFAEEILHVNLQFLCSVTKIWLERDISELWLQSIEVKKMLFVLKILVNI